MEDLSLNSVAVSLTKGSLFFCKIHAWMNFYHAVVMNFYPATGIVRTGMAGSCSKEFSKQ